MQRVVGHLVFGDVVKGVLEGPISDGVALSQPTSDGSVFELVDHAVGVGRLETPLEGFHLAYLVALKS